MQSNRIPETSGSVYEDAKTRTRGIPERDYKFRGPSHLPEAQRRIGFGPRREKPEGQEEAHRNCTEAAGERETAEVSGRDVAMALPPYEEVRGQRRVEAERVLEVGSGGSGLVGRRRPFRPFFGSLGRNW